MKFPIKMMNSLIVTAVTAMYAGGGIGEYTYSDMQLPSKEHPGKSTIPVEKVPLFICLGFDDNGIAAVQKKEGATWIREYLKNKVNPGEGNAATFDGSPMRASFYMTAKYGKEWVYENFPDVRRTWNNLYLEGHEIGNHSTEHLMKYDSKTGTVTNYDGRKYTVAEWTSKEIDPCHAHLTAPFNATSSSGGIGIAAKDIWGWRTPRLEWNDSLLVALKSRGFVYDCSIEETSEDGTDFYWPYTLDAGSPASPAAGNHPGLWEMPAYKFVIPEHLQGSDKVGAKIMTGLDYNVWVKKDWGGKALTGPEMTDILVYNLKQRMAGNRAPLLIGLHSDIYSTSKDSEYPNSGGARGRQLAIENFIDSAVALYPEAVRVVTASSIIQWMRNPSPLTSSTDIATTAKTVGKLSFENRGSAISVTVPHAGAFTFNLYSAQGRLLLSKAVGENGLISLEGLAAKGYMIGTIAGEGMSVSQKLVF